MNNPQNLAEVIGVERAPFTMLMSKPTRHDIDAILNREDGLTYNPIRQINEYDPRVPVWMGRCTCFRRNSTGFLILDNDRDTDD